MNKVVFLIFIACLYSICIAYSQGTSYPAGAYKNSTEFKEKKPSIITDFEIIKRSKDDIQRYGGADYWIISSDGTIKNKVLKKEIFAISTNDTLFINCYVQKFQKGYARVISEGEHIVFMGPINNDDLEKKMSRGYQYGLLGTTLAGAKIKSMSELYILNIDYGRARPLTIHHMENILESNAYLLQQFQSENSHDNETILRYLHLVNEN